MGAFRIAGVAPQGSRRIMLFNSQLFLIVFHVGGKFLWTALPDTGSLRRAMRRKVTARDDGRPAARPLM